LKATRARTDSLIVLVDLTYPFSGDVSLKPSDFQNGALAQFFAQTARH
jgi:hypothetical protein